MGIEDAFVLGRALASGRTVVEALKTYERLRQRRVRKIQLASRQMGLLGQLESPWLSTAARVLMRATPPALSQRATRALLTFPS